VAARLAAAVERRSPTVCVPGWLRAAQATRAVLPPLVTAIARREIPRIAADSSPEPTGLLGSGGHRVL
jgi:hypothetical protein